MAGRTVELTVAGETYRVITTADEQELRELAAMVEDKLGSMWQPGRPLTTRAMVLAAISLAHDVTEQRTRAERTARKAREALTSLLSRVDAALQESDALVSERDARRKGRSRNSDRPLGAAPSRAPTRPREPHGDDVPDDDG